MKTTLQLEETAMFLASYLFTLWLGYSWWLFFALLLAPDIGMVGYIWDSKVGAWTYNLFHIKGVAIVVGLLGYMISNDWVIFSGILLFGHSSMDRIFGYGLKYTDDFKHTHLGWIGQK